MEGLGNTVVSTKTKTKRRQKALAFEESRCTAPEHLHNCLQVPFACHFSNINNKTRWKMLNFCFYKPFLNFPIAFQLIKPTLLFPKNI